MYGSGILMKIAIPHPYYIFFYCCVSLKKYILCFCVVYNHMKNTQPKIIITKINANTKQSSQPCQFLLLYGL